MNEQEGATVLVAAETSETIEAFLCNRTAQEIL